MFMFGGFSLFFVLNKSAVLCTHESPAMLSSMWVKSSNIKNIFWPGEMTMVEQKGPNRIMNVIDMQTFPYETRKFS